jgi:hypothetical protein
MPGLEQVMRAGTPRAPAQVRNSAFGLWQDGETSLPSWENFLAKLPNSCPELVHQDIIEERGFSLVFKHVYPGYTS